MSKEIGSEFWLEFLPENSIKTVPAWLKNFGDVTFTSSGRGAISLMLEEIGELPNKSALLPSYICQSVVMPFVKKGYICKFYDINPDLTPDLDSIKKAGTPGIFFHLGYFGFPTNYVLADVVDELSSKGVVIVEDVTHTLFSGVPKFEANDYYIASLRKWLGLPSGGVLIGAKIKLEREPSINPYFSQLREVALLTKKHYRDRGSHFLKEKYRTYFKKAESWLNSNVGAYSMDDKSLTIINMINVEQLREKRFNNFGYLFKGLCNNPIIVPIFDLPDPALCPFFMPVYVFCNRNNIQRFLAKEAVFCPIHWEIPFLSCFRLGNKTKGIYQNILSIPCDQRYTFSDMGRIIELLNHYSGRFME